MLEAVLDPLETNWTLCTVLKQARTALSDFQLTTKNPPRLLRRSQAILFTKAASNPLILRRSVLLLRLCIQDLKLSKSPWNTTDKTFLPSNISAPSAHAKNYWFVWRRCIIIFAMCKQRVLVVPDERQRSRQNDVYCTERNLSLAEGTNLNTKCFKYVPASDICCAISGYVAIPTRVTWRYISIFLIWSRKKWEYCTFVTHFQYAKGICKLKRFWSMNKWVDFLCHSTRPRRLTILLHNMDLMKSVVALCSDFKWWWFLGSCNVFQKIFPRFLWLWSSLKKRPKSQPLNVVLHGIKLSVWKSAQPTMVSPTVLASPRTKAGGISGIKNTEASFVWFGCLI